MDSICAKTLSDADILLSKIERLIDLSNETFIISTYPIFHATDGNPKTAILRSRSEYVNYEISVLTKSDKDAEGSIKLQLHVFQSNVNKITEMWTDLYFRNNDKYKNENLNIRMRTCIINMTKIQYCLMDLTSSNVCIQHRPYTETISETDNIKRYIKNIHIAIDEWTTITNEINQMEKDKQIEEENKKTMEEDARKWREYQQQLQSGVVVGIPVDK